MQILTAALAPLTGLKTTEADVELEANSAKVAVSADEADTAYDAVYADPDA
jgi:hypothetical protein